MARLENNTIIFDTRKDFEAFSQVVRRSQLGLKTPEVQAVELIRSDEQVCENSYPENFAYSKFGTKTIQCGNKARFRLVRYRGKHRLYSQKYCASCLVKETNYWLNDVLAQITDLAKKEGFTIE